MIIAVAAIVISVLSMAVSAYRVVVLRRTQRRRAEWLSPYNVEEMAKRARRRAAGPAVTKIKITGTPPNTLIELGGKIVPARSADLHVDAESLPRLILTPDIFDVDVYLEGDVFLDVNTQRTLAALGWVDMTRATAFIVDGKKYEPADVKIISAGQ